MNSLSEAADTLVEKLTAQIRMDDLDPYFCPQGCGPMLRLSEEPTISNPAGREFPTWYCPDCGCLATR